MWRILVLFLSLVVAGCGGGQQQATDASAATLTPQSSALLPQDAAASTTRRLIAGMYVDTDFNGTAAQVYRLYRAAFSRNADAGGLGYQVGQIEITRLSLQQVAANFVASPEFNSTYGSLTNTQFVTLLYTNVLHRAPDDGGLQYWTSLLAGGTQRGDVLIGFSESNENKQQTAAEVAAGLTFQPWPNGRVFLTDGNYFETDPSGTAAQVFRVYQAAFGRTADPGGLGYHIGNIELAGLSLVQDAQNFMSSPEFQQKYGQLSNTDFVTQLYANVLHRGPDSGGLAYWTNLLGSGSSRVSVLLGFSESPENRANTLDAVYAGLRFQPWPSAPSMPMVNAPTGVTGTAATGAALGSVAVALKDSANIQSTTTTESNGRFRLDTSGLTPPFLLRASTAGAAALYSVSVDTSSSATINITPLTDAVVRSWYMLKNQSADSAFGSITSVFAPNAAQTATIAQSFWPVLQLAAQADGAALSTGIDIISMPFNADGTGMDKLISDITITAGSGGFNMQIVAGEAVQTTNVAVDAGTSTITATTTTTSGGSTTNSTAANFVPVQDAQAAALAAIQSTLDNAAATINARGAALTVVDLEPYFDPAMVNDGETRDQFLLSLVAGASQLTGVSLSPGQVQSLDTGAGTAVAVVTFTSVAAGQSVTQSQTFYFRESAGTWLITGNGRIARLELQAEGRRDSPHGSGGSSVNFGINAPAGTVSSVSASSTFAIPALKSEAQELSDGILFDVFAVNTGPISGPLPPAGTPVVFTLTLKSGGSVQYTLPINTWTNELIDMTAPTQTSLPAGPLTISWTRPTTYAVVRVNVGVQVFTEDPASGAGYQCIVNDVPTAVTATSVQTTVLSTCNGLPARYFTINVATEGPNGERSFVGSQGQVTGN